MSEGDTRKACRQCCEGCGEPLVEDGHRHYFGRCYCSECLEDVERTFA